MEFPNLLISNQIDSNNKYLTIGSNNNSLVMITDDMSCFEGDCAYGDPIVEIVWEEGLFKYKLKNIKDGYLYLRIQSIYLYEEVLHFEKKIEGEILNLEDYQPYFDFYNNIRYYEFKLIGINKCKTISSSAKCFYANLSANYNIRCDLEKIEIIKHIRNEDGNLTDPIIIREEYDLGNVPDIDITIDNHCGPPISVKQSPPCMFNKNSIIYKTRDFKEIDYYEKINIGEPGSGYYRITTQKTSGMNSLNRTFVFPLKIICHPEHSLEVHEVTPIEYNFDYTESGIYFQAPLNILLGRVYVTSETLIYTEYLNQKSESESIIDVYLKYHDGYNGHTFYENYIKYEGTTINYNTGKTRTFTFPFPETAYSPNLKLYDYYDYNALENYHPDINVYYNLSTKCEDVNTQLVRFGFPVHNYDNIGKYDTYYDKL